MASSSNSLDGAQSPIRPQSFSESRMWPSDSTISKIFNVRPADFNQSAARRQTFIDPIWNRQPSPPCKLMHVDLVEELNIKKGNSGNLRSTKMAEFVVHVPKQEVFQSTESLVHAPLCRAPLSGPMSRGSRSLPCRLPLCRHPRCRHPLCRALMASF